MSHANHTKNREFGTLVITGGSSGIGRGILEHFLHAYPKARAINLSRSQPSAIATSDRLLHLPVDLSEAAALEKTASAVIEALHESPGPVLMVNNSGIGRHERFQDSDPKHVLKTIDLNTRACVHLTGRLLPHLLEQGGTIVNVASTSAFQATPWMAAYGATKAFLLHWTLALGEDLRGTKVRALALCPGATDTPFIPQAGFNQSVRSFWSVSKTEAVVRALFRGLQKKRCIVIPGMINTIVACAASIAPKTWATRVAGWLIGRAKV